MKIALVSPYDFAYPGGVVNHVSSLARHLIKMGHKVKIIAPSSSDVSAFDGQFIPVGMPRSIHANDSTVRITLSLNLSSRVKAILDAENFDVVHLHEPLMPMLCCTILRLSRSPVVGTFHASYRKSSYKPGRPLDGYNFGWPITTMFLKRWAGRLSGRIAVSKPAMELAKRYFPGDYTIIPNGVELEHFSPDVSPIGEFRDGKTNILFVGRLEKRKGLDYLLKAYRSVKQGNPDCRLIIVGPGVELRRKYEKQVIQEGIKDVVFIGSVANEELPRFYKAADIFCAPATRCESFGIVLIEAMAMGKPVIASNMEGYADLVTHGVEGVLVPPKDKEMLALALDSLIRDESLREQMGARGRLKAQDYGWEHIARRVLDYYNKVCGKPQDERQAPEYEKIYHGSRGR